MTWTLQVGGHFEPNAEDAEGRQTGDKTDLQRALARLVADIPGWAGVFNATLNWSLGEDQENINLKEAAGA